MLLTCSNVEATALRRGGIDVGNPLPLKRQKIGADIEIVPTAAHTPGPFSYLWNSHPHRILFIGDTLVPVDGRWRYWVSKPNKDKMVASMRALGKLEFNVMVVNAFACTGSPCIPVTSVEKMSILSKVVGELS